MNSSPKQAETLRTSLIIQGGYPISGVHVVPGNKNAALPMLTASLLTAESITLTNLPVINDVMTTLDLLRAIGVEVQLDADKRSVTLCAKELQANMLPEELCAKVRATILFAGPMVARMGTVTIAQPGGDVIGRRPIDTHILALAELGAVFVRTEGGFRFDSPNGLKGADIVLEEASVTATENVLMASVLAKGRTTIFNAACEPHVQDLCQLLNAMGAKIEGIGTNYLVVDGVETLHGATSRIGSDYIDAGSYMVAALVTGGELTLEGIEERDFRILRKGFVKFGVTWQIRGKSLYLPPRQKLKIRSEVSSSTVRLEDGIWPAFPSDLMSILIVLAIYSEGTMLFFEKMFESRLYFVDHLIEMGAQIVQCDPHRILVIGSNQSKLHGSRVSSPDIRAGIALVIAALAAQGTTTIHNANSIDRGYEKVEDCLTELGAKVKRIRK